MLDVDGAYATFFAELKKPNTGVCLVWRIVRTDGVSYYYTDHDTDITVPITPGDSPLTFSPVMGGSGYARKQSEGLSVDNVSLLGMVDGGSPLIGPSEAEILNNVFSDAAVHVWLCIWTNLSAGLMPLTVGTIGPMTFRTHTFEAEVRGIAERLQYRVHRTYNQTCDATFGDARCGLTIGGSPESYQSAVSVQTVVNRRGFSVTTTGRAIDYFQYGLATFTSGPNNGVSREIVNHAHNGDSPLTETIVALYPFPYDITSGDTITLTAGCDKRATTCSTKFANLINFRGFHLLPTNEEILETPDAK